MKTSQKIYLPFKRAVGLIGSIIGIIFCAALLWWWVFPINAIVTKGHPVFIHQRLGKHKKQFGLIKFRSMRADANPNLAPSDMSAKEQKSMETKFGSFLRKSSIDETLQLFNIFVGQMAFIGPRPGAVINEEFLIKCREKYTPNAYDVKPGISGYAQIKMKRDHDPELKAKLDHEYTSCMSFIFDSKIFLSTVFKLFGTIKGR